MEELKIIAIPFEVGQVSTYFSYTHSDATYCPCRNPF